MTLGDNYLGNDFYCDVAIPHVQELEVMHEDEQILAFHHTKPHWRTHIVVVPKRQGLPPIWLTLGVDGSQAASAVA